MTKAQLLPAFVTKRLPSLDAILDRRTRELTAQVKFFYPDFGWTWYAVAWDGDDLFWGLVDGFEKELGYFRLSELMTNRGKLGCAIERDFYFKPAPVSEFMN